ncbi:MAG: tetratricopeptide repeat protein [Gemmatimonadaceae bacterium]
MRTLRRLTLLCRVAAPLGLAAFPAWLHAQRGAGGQPERPALDRGADANDWNAYFDLGVQALRQQRGSRAEAAFYWASQLAPDRAEPIFGRWVAFWMRDSKRWTGYLEEDPNVLKDPAVVAADSLPYRAMARNPWVHQGLAILLFDQLPGAWRDDALTRGWIAYARPEFERAVNLFGVALRGNGKQRTWIHTMRAQSFVMLARYDSAAAELAALESELRARDARVLGASYESKEMIGYALGVLHAARGQRVEARRALEQALTENFAFEPAHDLLGRLALAEGDTATAVREGEQAAELARGDPVMQYRHGLALVAAGRAAEAVAPLRRAVELAPWYAAPLYDLGVALDATGDREGARNALAAYVTLAPRTEAKRIAAARAY